MAVRDSEMSWMVDARVAGVCDAALQGMLPSQGDVEHLLAFDPDSPEAEYVRRCARDLGLRACDGHGFVFAQIGVDQHACPENCRFCAFAVCNADMRHYDPSNAEVPIERIVHCAKLFDSEGVDLVSLMATAGLDFERYLEIVRAVRANVSEHLGIMANVGDLTFGQALDLKEAGATSAYHALRIREGEITDIDPSKRLRTISHLQEAGIPLMTGIEPLWDGVDTGLVARRICDVREFGPFAIGACKLTEVEGADVGQLRPARTAFVRFVGSVARIACGCEVPIGGIGGVAWVDAGCDPRSRGYGEDDATLRRNVAAAKERLRQDGFSVN